MQSFLILGAPTAASAYSGDGAGTAQNPYRIATCDQLQSMIDDPSASYALSGNIDCSDSTNWNSNAGYNPISGFSGSLDGRNFTISGLTVNRPGDNTGNGGLFKTTNNATIKNLKFTGLSVTYTSGTNQAGLVGAMHGGSISFISINGIVTGTSSVAGVAASVDTSASINAASFTGSITNSGGWTGGLVTFLGNSSISNSYVNATIISSNSGGGLVASASTDGGPTVISNSYTTGTYQDGNYRSAFIGFSAMYSGSDHVTLNNNFTTMRPTGDGTNPSGNAYVAHDDGNTVMSNNYFDAYQTGSATNCVAGALPSGCTAVDPDGNAAHLFWGSLSAGPLGSWDFANTWNTYDNLPYLRDGALDAIDTITAPNAPTNLEVHGLDLGIYMTWTVPSDNGHATITDYNVQYRDAGTTTWYNVNHTPSTGHIFAFYGPANGNSYDVRVAAINSAGIGDYAEYDNIMVGAAPGQIQNLQFVNGITSLGANWGAPAESGYSAIDHYQFAYSLTGQNAWATYDVGGLSAGINGLNGGQYDIRVRAVSANGPGDWVYLNDQLLGIRTYTISTCQQLQDINNDMAGHYTLTQDIDCAETSAWDDGAGFSPLGITTGTSFTGSLDGQGHSITNLTEDNTGATHGPYGLGLFYTSEGATIQNLRINDSTFTGSGGGGVFVAYASNTNATNLRSNATINSIISDEVGGLFGSFTGDDLRANVVLSNSEFTGSVRSDSYTGGLIGYAGNVTIHDSYVHGTVASLNGASNIGGIAGYTDNTAIDNVYSTARVESHDTNTPGDYLGGLVGTMHSDSEISNSFAAGSIDTEVQVYGSVVAAGDAAQNLTNVYYDGYETGDHYCAGIGFPGGPGGEGPTCTEVNADGSNPNYFLGNHTNAPLDQWDFSNTWHIRVNDYPVFTDEYTPQTYEISTCEDLQNMIQDLQGDYELVNNIDCSQSATWNEGAGFLPIASGRMEGFSGSLNGNGFTISNLTINRPDAYTVGMIEGLNSGYIYDFGLSNPHITGSSNVGAVVGSAYNAGIFGLRVSNAVVTATNSFEGDVTQTSTGGIVGSFSTDLQGMYGMADDSFTGTVIGIENVGGLAGNYGGAVIFDSYANATVSGRNNVGGLVGQLNLGYFDNVYAAGTVSADGSDGGGTAGGLVGSAASLQVSDSFAVSTVTVPEEVTELGNGFIGSIGDSDITFSNDYYNSDNGIGICAAALGGPVIDDNCTGISLTDQPDYFKGNTTNDPLNGWNFEDTWYMHSNTLPTLYPLQQPQIECEELSGTSTSVNVHCDSFPDGWGTTTWEMQYQVSGSDTWTDVTLPNVNQAVKTITGLTPNTDYIVRFRFTNDWGTSDWGHIEYTTPAGSPITPVATTPATTTPPTITTIASSTLPISEVTAVSEAAQKIVLDDFSEYSSGEGKQLNLSVGEVIYFMVDGEQHTATVKEIGADYVILTIASTPHDVRIALGDSQDVSVHQNGTKDLSIRLISLQDGKAVLAFAKAPNISSPAAIAESKALINTNIWILLVLFPLLGYGLYTTRHKED